MSYYSNGLPGTMPVPMPQSTEKRSPYGAGPPFPSPYGAQSAGVNGIPSVNGISASINGIPPAAHMPSAGPTASPAFPLPSQMNPSAHSASASQVRPQFGQPGQYPQIPQIGAGGTYTAAIPQQPMAQYPRASTYLAPIPSSVSTTATQSLYGARQYMTAAYPTSQMPGGLATSPAYPGSMLATHPGVNMNPLYQPGAISAMPSVPAVAAATGSPYAMQAFPSSYGLSYPGGATYRPPF